MMSKPVPSMPARYTIELEIDHPPSPPPRPPQWLSRFGLPSRSRLRVKLIKNHTSAPPNNAATPACPKVSGLPAVETQRHNIHSIKTYPPIGARNRICVTQLGRLVGSKAIRRSSLSPSHLNRLARRAQQIHLAH